MKYQKKISLFLLMTTLGVLLLVFTNAAPAPKACSADKRAEILEAAGAKKDVQLNCSITLQSSDVVTKRMILTGIESSGVVIDCGGAKLVPNEAAPGDLDRIIISSRKIIGADGKPSWIRPSDIVIRNCEIQGSMRIMGMGSNGEAPDVKASSRQDDQHTVRARANAPTKILLEKMKIFGKERIPLYLSPGVTYVTLKDSEIAGKSISTAIYMDAESGFNKLINNKITTQTSRRELIALDGSSNNKIVGNYFSSLNNGGIYLYRNCGEGGTVRHNRPHHNHIINNFFYYNVYSGSNRAVNIASRDGGFRIYCHLDRGYPWGSSADNGDFATQNVVAQNEFKTRSPSDMIEVNDFPNIISNNRLVSERSNKPSVCYLNREAVFLRSGDSKIVRTSTGCKKFTCSGGLTIGVKVACAVPSCPLKDPKKGSCSFDVGSYKDGQRGGVLGDVKYDESCRPYVRVRASYNNADSGYVSGTRVSVSGDRGYIYTATVNVFGLTVMSSAGQKVCEVKF